MHDALTEKLCCPACVGRLQLADAAGCQGDITEGALQCMSCQRHYPIRRGVPRFVDDRYALNFGYQWNRFERSQLDSCSGHGISRDRFVRQTGLRPGELDGVAVLDAGCGAGRFAEVALSMGAEVFAVDLSSAVDACWRNLGHDPKLHVIQADINRLPFPESSFAFVYCFGVLQHTPDVKAAFAALAAQVAPGGRLVVDLYPRLRCEWLWPKHWIRPFTRRLPPERTFALVQRVVPVLLPVSRLLGRVPGPGRRLRHLVPVANYVGVYPLSPAQHLEWSLLDTFDMLSPSYDQPQTADTLRGWMEEADLRNIEIIRDGLLVGRGARHA